ncbi:MAG: alpha/beta hydrolase [Planctomycetota bacterium]
MIKPAYSTTLHLRWRTHWLVAVAVLCGCAHQLMPTPNLFIGSPDDPFAGVPSALQTNRVDVLYVTDRLGEDDKKGKLQYGFERCRSLSFGSLIVEIDSNLSWDRLTRESRTQNRHLALPLSGGPPRRQGQFPETPPPHIAGQGSGKLDPKYVQQLDDARNALVNEVSRRVAQYPAHKEATVFVHGYDYSLNEAAFVSADLWHFSGRRGVPIAYSWPSGQKYDYDRESGEFTVYHLKQFLRALASCPDLEKINIVAHSRGCDTVLSAIRELNIESRAAGENTRSQLKLENLILAAPDLDLGVAGQRIAAEGLFSVFKRTTVYVSTQDIALSLVTWMFQSRRLGAARAKDMDHGQWRVLTESDQTQVIDLRLPRVGMGHSYFHTDPAVSSDLIRILRDDRSPGSENGRPLIHREDGFWEIRENYLKPGFPTAKRKH